MGIWDWLKKKAVEPDQKPAEIVVDLPELDKDALLEETKSVFESDNEDVKELQLVEATPEYETGDVEIDPAPGWDAVHGGFGGSAGCWGQIVHKEGSVRHVGPRAAEVAHSALPRRAEPRGRAS